MKTNQNNFDRYGFSSIKRNIFNSEEIENIEKIFNEIISQKKNENIEVDYNCMGGKSVAVKNFIDENFYIKKFVNKIFEDKYVYNLIKDNIGENFKISEITYRRSYPGDIGLGIHQDASGENTIVLNLNGKKLNGKTCFVKSSHNFDSIKKLFNSSSISNKLTTFSKFFLEFADTSRGSLIMFDNKVWHGRYPNKSDRPSSSLLIGVYREGSLLKYDKENVFENIKEKLDLNLEIDKRRNLSHSSISKKSDGSFYINFNSLISNNNLKLNYKNLKTVIYIYFLRIIYFLKKKVI